MSGERVDLHIQPGKERERRDRSVEFGGVARLPESPVRPPTWDPPEAADEPRGRQLACPGPLGLGQPSEGVGVTLGWPANFDVNEKLRGRVQTSRELCSLASAGA